MSEVITEAVRILFAAGAPIWLVLAVVIVGAVAQVVVPKLRLPKLTVVPSPVVDEGGVQHPGTTLQPAPGDEGGFVLPTDPNREDLDSGGSG